MKLPSDLTAAFAKITSAEKTTSTEKTVYGTVVEQGGLFYVCIDGSALLTPISNTVEVKDGERVTVMLKNHSAVVTGNLSSPAVRTETVQILISDVANIEDVLIELETVSVEAFNNAVDRIDTLEDATSDLDVDLSMLTDKVNTNTSDITSLKEKEATDATNITALQELVETLQSEITSLKDRVTELES